MQCFRNFPVGKKFKDKKGESIKIFRRKNFSHSAEYFVEQPCCSVFQKMSGSQNLINKVGGGEY